VDYLVLALEDIGLTGLLVVLLLFAAKPAPQTEPHQSGGPFRAA
jgi:hypothetical protein